MLKRHPVTTVDAREDHALKITVGQIAAQSVV
jgi:hypothetical protein